MQAIQGGRLLVAPKQWEERERPSEAAGGTRGDAVGAPEIRNTSGMVPVLSVSVATIHTGPGVKIHKIDIFDHNYSLKIVKNRHICTNNCQYPMILESQPQIRSLTLIAS